MRYYVVINGESSLNIQGLAIQSLPNISKPLMRSRREEIDGRDGDIITKLGYSAYDKTLKIGLWGNYDINQVIAFFNQEGVITFSNEPDKYYNFTILNREDYINKLEAFREASITIHCQPFKYEINEQPIELDNEYITKTDTSMTFDNSVVATIEDISLKGNTLQNGTPTPTSPIPVNVVSGDNDIVVCGKNLFDKSKITPNSVLDASGGLASNNNYSVSAFMRVKPNTNYTFSASSNEYFGICTYDESKTFIARSYGTGTTTNRIFTTGNNVAYIRTQCQNTNIDNFQIVVGNQVPTTYSPYTGTTYNIDLPEEMELCKIGNYQDYFYKQDDKWYLHKEIGKITFVGGTDENWQYANPELGIFRLRSYLTGNSTDRTYVPYSNYYQGIAEQNAGTERINGKFYINSQNNFIDFLNTSITNATDFKTWLSTHNTIVYYVLATTTNTEITYTPLIEQLEAILEAQSKNGTTNIIQVNNDAPFIITASVLCGGNSVVVNNKGNIYSKPIMTIYGSGTIGVYLSDTQIFNINLGDEEYITLDTANMEAYKVGVLKNRLVNGDYNSFKLETGNNTISFTGNVIKVELENYSRWI